MRVQLYQGQFRPHVWTDLNACQIMIRICLIDFNPSVRAVLCLRLALEPDFLVLDDSADRNDPFTQLTSSNADIAILDLVIPLPVQEAANALLIPIVMHCPVIVLSLYDDPATRAFALRAGAARVISKHESDDELVRSVRSVSRHSR